MALLVARADPADDLAERDAGRHDEPPSGATGQMIERTDDPGDGLIRDVGVDLGSRHAGMAEQDLHDADVRPPLEQVRGEGMAKAAHGNALAELGGGRGALAALLNGGQADGTIGIQRTGKEPSPRTLILPVEA